MNYHKRNRDFALMWLVGGYLLNILDANVGAHLLQFNVDQDLSFQPISIKTISSPTPR